MKTKNCEFLKNSPCCSSTFPYSNVIILSCKTPHVRYAPCRPAIQNTKVNILETGFWDSIITAVLPPSSRCSKLTLSSLPNTHCLTSCDKHVGAVIKCKTWTGIFTIIYRMYILYIYNARNFPITKLHVVYTYVVRCHFLLFEEKKSPITYFSLYIWSVTVLPFS